MLDILFAVVALSALLAQSRRLNAVQARQLAASIGIVRNVLRWGRWTTLYYVCFFFTFPLHNVTNAIPKP